MKIVLIGYGKMGKTIERLAESQGHLIVGKIDIDTTEDQRLAYYTTGDVAIEFSHPEAAFDNITGAIIAGIPVVSGTTGWLSRYDDIKKLVSETKGSFLYASNFSIGVNVMFALNEKLAKIMNQYPAYNASVDEVHHVHKKDAPSGTALTLINGVIDHVDNKVKWSLTDDDEDTIKINATREGEVYGDHRVRYKSDIDTIELYHTAHTRDGFALGAIMAAVWLYNGGQLREGIHSMRDMMGLD